MITLNKRNIAIILMVLVLFVMLPLDFTWKETALDYMDFEEEPMSAVLFWIFYISIVVTALAALFNRYDISKLSSIVSLVFIFVLVAQTINTVHYSRTHSFISAILGETQFGYAFIALTICIFLLSRPKAK